MTKHKIDSILEIQEKEQERRRLLEAIQALEAKNTENEKLMDTLLGVTDNAE